MNQKTLFMVEIAVFAALALLLDLVSGFIFSRIWPQGGSVSIAMVPVFLMAFRWGIKGGVLTGVLLGAFQILFGAVPFHLASWIIDYVLAFGVVGLSGVFMNKIAYYSKKGMMSKVNAYVVSGVFIGSFLRFLCHFASGVLLFGMYAPKGQPATVYSFIYNGTYMLPSAILSAVVLILIYAAAPKVLLKKAY
ncbi:energy-coupled thiamine transporter ThiT [Bacillus massiliglaciei]|uniref:energy-coupled thiamine transporter ThiT n=1 Tax=Bacillus massiliglaciei TaxID=1816693 RepID=UPI000A969680|nr:energy-coupled thiamine transporter ThiT [Bacillus massiliglaciei]